jgi:predicted esterase
MDATTCFFLPERPTRTLLIYLHGVVPPEKSSVQKTAYQAVVAKASARANAAALLPRGNQGLAPKGLERWWGWPTSPNSYQRYGVELVGRIETARRDLERATGVRFERVYLAGSSSGAYFVATLAQRNGIRVDGFGALSGGTAVLAPALAAVEPRPVYIGFGSYDTVGESARALGKVFRDARWPVKVAEHKVGHGAREVYLDEAFPFWAEHAP